MVCELCSRDLRRGKVKEVAKILRFSVPRLVPRINIRAAPSRTRPATHFRDLHPTAHESHTSSWTPLSTWRHRLDKGTNFAIFSQDATRVDLCLFDAKGKQTDCIALRERTAFVWHGFVRDIKPGQFYGFRIEGPWEPEKGHRFNYNKLLVDPYAKAISGKVDWKAPIFPYDVASGDDLKMDTQDSADGVPKSVVVDPRFNWDNDCPPETPLADSVIYEVHVKGFSMRNPAVPEEIRGTYAGLGHASSIEYFKKLGVTAVELLPVHHFIDDGHLIEKGLVNYWGYNTLGLTLFRQMLRRTSPIITKRLGRGAVNYDSQGSEVARAHYS